MHTLERSPQPRTDDELLAALTDLTLPPADFDHRGHLRVAWLNLQRHALAEAISRTCDQLRAFAVHAGVPARFSRPLTEALLRIMHARGAADPARGFADFLAENADLVHDARGVVRRHDPAALPASVEGTSSAPPPIQGPPAP